MKLVKKAILGAVAIAALAGAASSIAASPTGCKWVVDKWGERAWCCPGRGCIYP